MKRSEVGNKIRIARITKGMTQTELAQKMHVSQGAVGSWEIGYTLPRAGNLAKLSELLEIPVDDILKAG